MTTRLWPVPEGMGPQGAELWRRVGTVLVRSRVLTELDRATFECLCRAYQKFCDADAIIATEGLTAPGHRGINRKHPLFSEWKASLDLYTGLAKQFGLSPASRGVKIESPRKEQKNEKARFFK